MKILIDVAVKYILRHFPQKLCIRIPNKIFPTEFEDKLRFTLNSMKTLTNELNDRYLKRHRPFQADILSKTRIYKVHY